MCSAQWFHEVADRYFNPSDSDGHGPDLGSQWLSTVERKAKLPVREDPGAERCERIQPLLQRRTFIIHRALGLDIFISDARTIIDDAAPPSVDRLPHLGERVGRVWLLGNQFFWLFRKRIGSGILAYGPPGCGKTLLVRATA